MRRLRELLSTSPGTEAVTAPQVTEQAAVAAPAPAPVPTPSAERKDPEPVPVPASPSVQAPELGARVRLRVTHELTWHYPAADPYFRDDGRERTFSPGDYTVERPTAVGIIRHYPSHAEIIDPDFRDAEPPAPDPLMGTLGALVRLRFTKEARADRRNWYQAGDPRQDWYQVGEDGIFPRWTAAHLVRSGVAEVLDPDVKIQPRRPITEAEYQDARRGRF